MGCGQTITEKNEKGRKEGTNPPPAKDGAQINLPPQPNKKRNSAIKPQNNEPSPAEEAPAEENKKVVPVEDALGSNKYYSLGILSKYFTDKGIESEIVQKKVKNLNKFDIEDNKKFLQLLVNTFSDQKKIELTLNCGNRNQALLKEDNEDEQKEFIDDLKGVILKHFSLNENDIEITPPKNTETEQIKSFKISVIFKGDISKINKLNEDGLKKAINRDIKGCKVQDFQPNFLLGKVNLNLGIVNPKGDVLNDSFGKNEKRGGMDYFSPSLGWKAYGLDTQGKIKKNEKETGEEWLGFVAGNEWPIAYYGTSQSNNPKYKDLKNDINKINSKLVGEGVYITPNPDIMEEEAKILELEEQKKFKVGFMVRVNPNKIRISTKNENYWIVEGDTKEIRPYRILVKEVV